MGYGFPLVHIERLILRQEVFAVCLLPESSLKVPSLVTSMYVGQHLKEASASLLPKGLFRLVFNLVSLGINDCQNVCSIDLCACSLFAWYKVECESDMSMSRTGIVEIAANLRRHQGIQCLQKRSGEFITATCTASGLFSYVEITRKVSSEQ